MGKLKVVKAPDVGTGAHPAITPEGRVAQLGALAYDIAEQQMRDGTASSQVITYFLKANSQQQKLEHELKMKELELMAAKTEQIKSTKRSEELMEEAIKAFRNYSGNGTPDEYEDPDLY